MTANGKAGRNWSKPSAWIWPSTPDIPQPGHFRSVNVTLHVSLYCTQSPVQPAHTIRNLTADSSFSSPARNRLWCIPTIFRPMSCTSLIFVSMRHSRN